MVQIMLTRIQTKNGSKEINLNRRKAIRERCLNCSGWSYSEVENCKFIGCHLYAFRMKVGKQNSQARSKAIRNHCLNCCARNQNEVYHCPATDCPLYAYRKSHIDTSAKIDPIQEKDHIQRAKKTLNSKSMSQHALMK